MAASAALRSNATLTPHRDELVVEVASNGSLRSEKLSELANGSAMRSRQHVIRRSRKPTDDSLLNSVRAWLVYHQLGFSLNLLILHQLADWFFPPARHYTRAFTCLSYYDSTTNRYGRGVDDWYFVAYSAVMLTALRVVTMTYVLLPFAGYCGIQKAKAKLRFAEQGWAVLSYTVSFCAGCYVMFRSPYFLNLPELWTDFPTITMDAMGKCYYLVQLAFWLHQIFVLNIEQWRKDHLQMLSHHIVTFLLITTSYAYYQTRVGNVILCLMDFGDISLSTAKMLKYAGWQKTCDAAFGFFMISWIIARHVAYNMVCWSVFVDVPERMPYTCHSVNKAVELGTNSSGRPDKSQSNEVLGNVLHAFLNPEAPVCFNRNIHNTFIGMLLFLQGLLLIWFYMIVRVAWRTVTGQGADDSRSDDEDDEEVDVYDEVVEVTKLPPAPKEQVVSGDGLSFTKKKESTRYRPRRPGNPAASISLAGHPDKKELLGRIGCDKPS